jgi:hypothetical protein
MDGGSCGPRRLRSRSDGLLGASLRPRAGGVDVSASGSKVEVIDSAPESTDGGSAGLSLDCAKIYSSRPISDHEIFLNEESKSDPALAVKIVNRTGRSSKIFIGVNDNVSSVAALFAEVNGLPAEQAKSISGKLRALLKDSSAADGSVAVVMEEDEFVGLPATLPTTPMDSARSLSDDTGDLKSCPGQNNGERKGNRMSLQVSMKLVAKSLVKLLPGNSSMMTTSSDSSDDQASSDVLLPEASTEQIVSMLQWFGLTELGALEASRIPPSDWHEIYWSEESKLKFLFILSFAVKLVPLSPPGPHGRTRYASLSSAVGENYLPSKTKYFRFYVAKNDNVYLLVKEMNKCSGNNLSDKCIQTLSQHLAREKSKRIRSVPVRNRAGTKVPSLERLDECRPQLDMVMTTSDQDTLAAEAALNSAAVKTGSMSTLSDSLRSSPSATEVVSVHPSEAPITMEIFLGTKSRQNPLVVIEIAGKDGAIIYVYLDADDDCEKLAHLYLQKRKLVATSGNADVLAAVTRLFQQKKRAAIHNAKLDIPPTAVSSPELMAQQRVPLQTLAGERLDRDRRSTSESVNGTNAAGANNFEFEFVGNTILGGLETLKNPFVSSSRPIISTVAGGAEANSTFTLNSSLEVQDSCQNDKEGCTVM